MPHMKKLRPNERGGFLQLILIFLIALFLMNYFHITFHDFLVWFKEAIHNVFG